MLKRSRHIIRLDLKRPEAVALTLRLIEQADALIEGFRPKVMERLGLGPDICLARNPRLVFGRVTGWGQDGPLAHAAGHDLNYIALTGALHAIGRAGGTADAAAQSGRRFRRRRAVSRGRRAGRDHRGAAVGQGPGGRRRDGGWRVVADDLDLWRHGVRPAERPARRRTSPIPARTSTRSMNAPTATTSRWRRSRRSSTPNCCGCWRSIRRRCRHRWIAHAGRRRRRGWPSASARARATNGARCWRARDACFAPVLSMEEAPHHPHNRGAQGVRRARRRDAARAGAALQPDAARCADAAASGRGGRCARGAVGLGPERRRRGGGAGSGRARCGGVNALLVPGALAASVPTIATDAMLIYETGNARLEIHLGCSSLQR